MATFRVKMISTQHCSPQQLVGEAAGGCKCVTCRWPVFTRGCSRLPSDCVVVDQQSSIRSEVVVLDVLDDEGEVLSLLTVVLDGDGGSALHLSGVALLVVLAETEPLTQVHARVNLDQRDATGSGHSGDELLVLGIFAVRGEDADKSLLSVESLENFIESLNESY